MKGNRAKNQGESIPISETIGLTPENKFQFRYNFKEFITEDGDNMFAYEYVNINPNARKEKISSIIRTRYSADEVESILRNQASKYDVITYLRYNHFTTIAKAITDSMDVPALKAKVVYEINIPLSITLQGADYSIIADRMLKSGVHFEPDAINDTVKVYVSWISEADESLMGADTRISINTIPLYEEL